MSYQRKTEDYMPALVKEKEKWKNTSQTPAASGKVFNYLEERLRGDTPTPSVTPTAAPSGAPVTAQVTAPTTTTAPTVTPTPTTTVTPTDPRKAQLEAEIAEVQKKVESSFQVLIDLQNKKFTYNERSSPIYSIMREEYQKRADRAAAQAYARSVANTGGYGSSYATLAAEEASRAVMDGWDDAQYDLYAAARQQFADEKASATEVYGLYKGLLEEKEAEMSLLEAEEKAALEKEAAKAAEREKWILDAYATVSESWAESGSANEATVRSMLANSLPADVENPQELVDEVIRRLKADSTAAITDAVSVFKNSPTVEGAQAIYNAAKTNGTLKEYEGEISTSLMTLATDAMGGDADAAAALGLNAQAFSELDADGKAEAALDVMGQLNQKGLIQGDAFVSFLKEDLDEDLDIGKPSGNFKYEALNATADAVYKYRKKNAAVQTARGVIDLYEKGYLTSEQYEGLLRYIVNKTDPIEVNEDGTVSNTYSSEYSEGEIAAWRELRKVIVKDVQEKNKKRS